MFIIFSQDRNYLGLGFSIWGSILEKHLGLWEPSQDTRDEKTGRGLSPPRWKRGGGQKWLLTFLGYGKGRHNHTSSSKLLIIYSCPDTPILIPPCCLARKLASWPIRKQEVGNAMKLPGYWLTGKPASWPVSIEPAKWHAARFPGNKEAGGLSDCPGSWLHASRCMGFCTWNWRVLKKKYIILVLNTKKRYQCLP